MKRRLLQLTLAAAVGAGLSAAVMARRQQQQKQLDAGPDGHDDPLDAIDWVGIEPAPVVWGNARAPEPEPPIRRPRGRRVLRVLVPLAAVVAVAATLTGAAVGYFTAAATTGSNGAASAASLSLGNTPTLSLTGRDVQVSWAQNTPSFLSGTLGADANGGYLVNRYADSGGGAITPGASCSGLQQGSSDPLSCTETGLSTGRWTYTVTPQFYSWLGAESAQSTHVIIPPAAPSSVSLTNGAGVGSAYISPTNDTSLSVDVALPSTSLASDTVKLTLSDGTSTVTPATQSGTAGAGTLHFTGIDVSTLNDGTITITAKATSSYGDASSNTSITVTKDTVAPSVSITPSSLPNANGWYDSSVTFSASTSTDPSPGSGIQSCDPDVTYSGPDTSAGSLTFNCTDKAGNTGSNSVLFKYDSTAPSGAVSLASSPAPVGAYFATGTLYFNPNAAGSFALVDTVTDTTSGPASATFTALSATGWTHSLETVSTPTGGPYQSSTYSWTTGAATPASQTTTSTDIAGNTATETLTFVGDSTAPTGGALTVNGTAATSGGSTSSTSSTSFTIGSRTDYAETLSGTQSGLSSSVLTIQSETLSGSTCGSPGSGGPYTTAQTITGTTNPSITAGYCYVYTLTGTDNVGNSASISTTVKVTTVTPFGATDLGSTDSNPDTSSYGGFTGPTVSTTSGRTELIFIHVKYSNSSSTTVSSISGPFSGASLIGSTQYYSYGGYYDYVFAYQATGSGSSGGVTVSFNGMTNFWSGGGGMSIDVVQLDAGNTVLGCSNCTNSGNSTSPSATLTVQDASDTEVAFFGVASNETFSTPTGFSQLASGSYSGGSYGGSNMGTSSFATSGCGSNVTSSAASSLGSSAGWGAIGIEIQATAPACTLTSLGLSGSLYSVSGCSYGQSTTGCTSSGYGSYNTFSPDVTFLDQNQNLLTNTTGSSVPVTCSLDSSSGTPSTSTPGSSIANGSSTTSSAPLTASKSRYGSSYWNATFTCSATVSGTTYTIQVYVTY